MEREFLFLLHTTALHYQNQTCNTTKNEGIASLLKNLSPESVRATQSFELNLLRWHRLSTPKSLNT